MTDEQQLIIAKSLDALTERLKVVNMLLEQLVNILSQPEEEDDDEWKDLLRRQVAAMESIIP